MELLRDVHLINRSSSAEWMREGEAFLSAPLYPFGLDNLNGSVIVRGSFLYGALQTDVALANKHHEQYSTGTVKY